MNDRLRSKGWTEQELEHLEMHFNPQKEARFLVLFGMALLAVAVLLVPWAYSILGYLLEGPLFLAALAVIGLPLGAVFATLLVDLDRLDHRHHLALVLSVPVVALFASAWLISLANATAPDGASTHNALIGGIVYAVAFITPYAFLVMHEWNSLTGRSTT